MSTLISEVTEVSSALFLSLRYIRISQPTCCGRMFCLLAAVTSDPLAFSKGPPSTLMWHRDSSVSPHRSNKHLKPLPPLNYLLCIQEAFTETCVCVCVCVVLRGQGRKTGCVDVCVSMLGPSWGSRPPTGGRSLDFFQPFPLVLSRPASKQHPTAFLTHTTRWPPTQWPFTPTANTHTHTYTHRCMHTHV